MEGGGWLGLDAFSALASPLFWLSMDGLRNRCCLPIK